MSNYAIEVENLSKQFHIGRNHSYNATLRDALMEGMQKPLRWFRSNGRDDHVTEEDTIWALKDVSFNVYHGEVVGIIGRNGAGKSTLLKILSRITEPTMGHARINGRVSSLLEVGTGFHPELTGRENIYLNGAILGMHKTEIDRKFDEIVAFSEIERFLDTPVKRFSSGMYVRLAFAVAAHLEPEILLVDEVLAVGDAAFQKKCLGKMGSVASEGRTVLFVSHNMATIHSLCPRSLLLGQGNKIFDGVTEEAIQLYLSTSTTQGEAFIPSETPRMGSGVARFDAVRIFNEEGQITNSIFMGSNFSVEIDFHCLKPVENINFDVSIRGPMQERILQFSSQVTQGKMPSASHGGSVRLFIENLNLLPGSYYITITMTRKGEKIDMVENILKLDVTPQGIYETGKLPRYGNALIYLPCHWQAKYT